MTLPFYRPTIATINLDALTHNINFFRDRLSKDFQIMAIVKADAYGHGVIPIVKHLKDIGITYFAVGFLDEALQIRKAGFKDPILVLGYTPKDGIELAFENNVALTVFSHDIVDQINLVGEKYRKKLKVHIKVDTGMGRIGIFPSELYSFFMETKNKEWIDIEGVYTHFATADEKDKTFTLKQTEIFNNALEKIRLSDKINYIHLSNSAALIDLPEIDQNIARLGISLYGLLPSSDVNLTQADLEPVMSLKTEIIYLKEIESGQTISYGATYKAKRKTLVATLPIGYADGLSRKLSNKGYVLIHGQRAPIIGRVCMDQTMIDVTDISQVKVGDQVIIFGSQDGNFLSIDEQAKIAETINYELVTLIGKRIPRIYYKNGEIVEVSNYLLA